ncbi:hypothetical protein ACJ73_04124 [Blastomyces percursus]|uniref:Uncharacterized protein n=1 Tax=Blastomyces percursus TaxID=1658174 RepID=A0A1J9R960_9EURO|nr:hypothetical protein ACJ73_04124 [Blastomyces percursus]
MASLLILFLLGGSWFLLVTFLVLSMFRQKYTRRASSNSVPTFGRSSSSTNARLATARTRDLTAPSISSMAPAAAADKTGAPKKA